MYLKVNNIKKSERTGGAFTNVCKISILLTRDYVLFSFYIPRIRFCTQLLAAAGREFARCQRLFAKAKYMWVSYLKRKRAETRNR